MCAGIGFSRLPSEALEAAIGAPAAVAARAFLYALSAAAFAFRAGNFYCVVGLFSLVCDLLRLKLVAYAHLLRAHCGEHPALCFDRHLLVRRALSVVSHRFRLFLALAAGAVGLELFYAMFLLLRRVLPRTHGSVVAASGVAARAIMRFHAPTCVSSCPSARV